MLSEGAETLAEQEGRQTWRVLGKQDDRKTRWNQKANEIIH